MYEVETSTANAQERLTDLCLLFCTICYYTVLQY